MKLEVGHDELSEDLSNRQQAGDLQYVVARRSAPPIWCYYDQRRERRLTGLRVSPVKWVDYE